MDNTQFIAQDLANGDCDTVPQQRISQPRKYALAFAVSSGELLPSYVHREGPLNGKASEARGESRG